MECRFNAVWGTLPPVAQVWLIQPVRWLISSDAVAQKLRAGSSPHPIFAAAIGKILRQLCEWKGVKIIEAEACPNHIHLFVEIPPKISVSHFMGYLKGKSSTMLYEQFGELKYKYRNREFWCRGYYVDTVGKNESRIAEYVRNQLKEDEMGEQLRIPSNSPFTGGK